MVDIKNLKPKADSKFKQGYYKLINESKYAGDKSKIIYRSSWEKKFCAYLDLNPEVTRWSSEGMSIDYFFPEPYGDNKIHKYFPDFIFEKGGIKYIVEVKPKNQLKMPEPPKRQTPKAMENYRYLATAYTKNYFKRIAVDDYIKNHPNCKFVYLTEDSHLA